MNPRISNLLRGGGGGGPVLPPAGRTMLAKLTSSLILDEGTGAPTWSRATKAWGFNELGYLKELASGCAFFGGARNVYNRIRTISSPVTSSENFSNAVVSGLSLAYSSGVVTASVSNATSFFRICSSGAGFAYPNITIGDETYVAVKARGVAGSIGKKIYIKSESVGDKDNPVPTPVTLTADFQTVGYRRNAKINTADDYLYCSLGDAIANVPAGTTVEFKELQVNLVTGYDASYVPEYVSVGVESSPYHGAGIDGAKYFETDWQGAPIAAANLLGFRIEAAATNNLLHSRDLSNAAWSTKTNITAAKTATGLDGIANTATTLTATAADAIILQPITLASAARCASAYVKRRTGTGTISFTQDGGSTWTDITSQINSSTWSRVQITATLANPSVGFKISTSGDAIDVDCAQNEAGTVATSPIVTTTAAVTRNEDSNTYQTADNWSDTAGTAYIEAQPWQWSVGGLIGSATNGLLESASNSGATAYDGTNAANGPTGTPSGRKKLAMRWGGGAMTVASDGVVGTPGTYDGGMGLESIGIGINSSLYCRNVAIYNYAMTDAELQAITS